MGKVAKAFGVGVKGVLDVVLPRDSFDAGDAIAGVVALRVSKPIQCQELVLSIEGTESVGWSEQRGDYSRRHSRVNSFLRERVVLSAQASYEPGEYTFPFSYRLQASLPSSFDLTNRRAKLMEHLTASIAYAIKATLTVTTSFSSDLECARAIEGTCAISAQMDQDACVAGDLLLVQASIHNQSTADMSSVVVRLYEHLKVLIGPEQSNRHGSMCVCETRMSGVRAGERRELVLSLPVAADADSPPIYPTSWSGTFVKWKFKLVIKCKFTLATGVEVEIPVVVLPPARPTDLDIAQVVVVPAVEPHESPLAVSPAP